MNRAYAVLNIKAVDSVKRTFSGMATTPTTDRMGEIVDPMGARFKLPLPLLWQHDSTQPIGWVRRAKVSAKGIEIDGEVADIPEDGALKARLTEAWQSIQSQLVRGLSIGFSPLEMEPLDPKMPYGPMRFRSWEWLELSAVTIPANQDASITAIKSIDDRLRLAASGRSAKTLSIPSAGVTAPRSTSRQGSNMKTIQEQLAELKETRQTKAARMNELVQVRESEARASSEDEAAEFDGLNADVIKLDDDIRKKALDLINIARAKPVGESENGRRGAPMIHIKGADQEESFKGQNFTRMVIAKALARIDEHYRSPATIAEARWGKTNPTLVAIMKANEVPGGGSLSGEWGAELVQADTRYTGDFIEFLYGATVYDKLALTAVPANVVVKGQDGASTGYWVGQSKAIPNTNADFSTVTLSPLKVAALAVVSNELLRDSTPAADMLVRNALVEASSQRVDTTFLSATAAASNVSPAGILNGLVGISATGSDGPSLRADIRSAYAPFFTAKNASGLTLVMDPSMAKAISLMVNALGITEFPGITATGGTLLGDPVVTGNNVPAGDVILLKASEIYKIGDGGVQISISRDAMIEQSSAPIANTATPAAATQVFTSMFQEESTAIKVVRSINFAKRRASAVSFITGADYGTSAS